MIRRVMQKAVAMEFMALIVSTLVFTGATRRRRTCLYIIEWK
jgi:hypothetical protein